MSDKKQYKDWLENVDEDLEQIGTQRKLLHAENDAICIKEDDDGADQSIYRKDLSPVDKFQVLEGGEEIAAEAPQIVVHRRGASIGNLM